MKVPGSAESMASGIRSAMSAGEGMDVGKVVTLVRATIAPSATLT